MRLITAVLSAATLPAGCAAGRPSTPVPLRPVAPASDTLAALPAADRVRLAEAFRLASAVGNRVWPGWDGAPFAVLLITPEREFLVRHPRPSTDFTRVGYDSVLAADVLVRRRVFPPGFEATFPAVGGVPTVVIGQPANTGQTSTRWVLTVVHEHFHQLQYSRPDYYPGVAALGLTRGDTTGMWMLNYAFPYDSATVQARFAAFTRSLDTALAPQPAAGRARPGGDPRAHAVTAAWAQLRAALSADDNRYLAFQMWQEGVARYTELQVARLAAAPPYTPGPAFRALPDYTEYAAAAAAIKRGIRARLRDPDLGRAKRVAFYPAGAATALVLDGAAPGWRSRYFAQNFSLAPLLP